MMTRPPHLFKESTGDLRVLVLEIAKTTGFGYSRIICELRRLGIKKISRQTVRDILKEEGIEPGPTGRTTAGLVAIGLETG